MSVNQLIVQIRESNEDYEWYPTTNEIIQQFRKDLHQQLRDSANFPHASVLDIGAGNGKVLTALKELSIQEIEKARKEGTTFSGTEITELYAIEKSQVLIGSLPENIFVIGTDFWQQTLIDKHVDVIFSNPPYSQFSEWSEKIIKEANAKYVYLVIPTRWADDKRIALALEKRNVSAEIVGEYSFEHSEDRRARAQVNLVRINMHSRYERKSDPFELWFNETYAFDESDNDLSDYEKARAKREDIHNQLVPGQGLIERLEELYLKDMEHLHLNYKSIASIDAELLEQMGISKISMMEAMKTKIQGLKSLYWEELFSNLDSITSRLTTKSRKTMLQKLHSHITVDFTVNNAYNIVIWAIKNANKYFDEQLLDLYYTLAKPENIKLYKSNTRIIHDDWRYLKDTMTHYALDYRIVLTFYGLIGSSSYYTHRRNGLHENASDTVADILVVARNLGFIVEETSHPDDPSMVWESQVKNNFYMKAPANRELKKGTRTNLGKVEESHYLEEEQEWQFLIDGYWRHYSHVKLDEDILVEIKAFKNGNLHLKFNQRFMKALNIQAARLNKWIRTPDEAADEFDITVDEAHALFDTNYFLTGKELPLLLPEANSSQDYEADDEPAPTEEPSCFSEGTLF